MKMKQIKKGMKKKNTSIRSKIFQIGKKRRTKKSFKENWTHFSISRKKKQLAP